MTQGLVCLAAGWPDAHARRTTAQQNAKPWLRKPHLQILWTDELKRRGSQQVMPDHTLRPSTPPNSDVPATLPMLDLWYVANVK